RVPASLGHSRQPSSRVEPIEPWTFVRRPCTHWFRNQTNKSFPLVMVPLNLRIDSRRRFDSVVKLVISVRGDASMIQTDSDRTIAFAEQALGQIKALKLPGDPRSFEIWYTYVAGTRPKLNAFINDLLAQRPTLSGADLDQIHYQFFSPARAAEKVETVGAK